MGVKNIICANCGKSHDIDLGEYNYQVRRGRENFFCSRTCSAHFNNKKHRKWFKRTQTCRCCGKLFETESHYEVTFCSRECASAGSITNYRRQQMSEGGKKGQFIHPGTPLLTSQILKNREAWKYAEIKELLEGLNIEYEFEYLLDNKYIFDLVIEKWRLLIEFDGTYHQEKNQSDVDKCKTKCAESNGYTLIRIQTKDNIVIPASSLYDTIAQHIK